MIYQPFMSIDFVRTTDKVMDTDSAALQGFR